MGHTHNSVFINADIEHVFNVTNAIDHWKDLFSEYRESTVLRREGSKVTFKLETHPDNDGHFHSWTSERVIDRDNYKCEATRLEPKYPFKFMNIIWEYKVCESGTEMIWMQDFETDNKCPWDDKKLEDYINKNSKTQMQVIKNKIESGFNPE